MFSVHTKTQSPRFQIPPVSRAFSKSFVFVTDYPGLSGLTVEIKLYAFLNSSGVVWTESGANHDVNEHHQIIGLMSKTRLCKCVQ